MIINIGDFLININPAFIIYPVLLCLIILCIAAVAGYAWVCSTRGGDPLFNIPQRTRRSGSTVVAVNIDLRNASKSGNKYNNGMLTGSCFEHKIKSETRNTEGFDIGKLNHNGEKKIACRTAWEDTFTACLNIALS